MAIKLDKTNLVRNLAVKNKLIPFIEQEIGKGDFVWEYQYEPKKGDDGWHPSGHCTPSLAELYHYATAKKVKEAVSASLYKTFQVGHFWHQYLQEIILRTELAKPEDIERRGTRGWGDIRGVLVEEDGTRDVGYKPYHYATGSGDIAPCKIPKYGDFVVDFKTMKYHDFRQPNIPAWSADKYECQINIYMDFFDLEQGLIVAICKDSPHDLKEFTYTRNQPLIDAIYTKWKIVSECITQKIVPPDDEEFPLPLRGPDA